MKRLDKISLYVPPNKQLVDVLNALRDEYGISSNIKDKITRESVATKLCDISAMLKSWDGRIPKNGVIIFYGRRLRCILPEIPVKIYLLRIDSKLHKEHLEEIIKEANETQRRRRNNSDWWLKHENEHILNMKDSILCMMDQIKKDPLFLPRNCRLIFDCSECSLVYKGLVEIAKRYK